MHIENFDLPSEFEFIGMKKGFRPLIGNWTDVLMKKKNTEGQKSRDTVPLNGSKHKYKWFWQWIKTDAASTALRVKNENAKNRKNVLIFA
jgi:hypothetical protein